MLGLSYIILSVLMTLIIVLGFKSALNKMDLARYKKKKSMNLIVISLVSWFIYLGILSHFELLFDLSLPPRFVFLLLIPFFGFTIIFYVKNKNNQVIQNIPKTWTHYYQSFRVPVEFLLLRTFYEGIIPELATFKGINFDVFMGVTAPFVAYFLIKNKQYALVKFWNTLGITMVGIVGFVIATSTYFPTVWATDMATVDLQFFTYPYILIPGFLAPSAIFIHVVALIQLRKPLTL